MSNGPSQDSGMSRKDQASEWFARMRGPEAEASRHAFDSWHADPANARAYAEIEAIWSLAGASRPGESRPQSGRGTPQASDWGAATRSWKGPVLAAAAVALAVVVIALLLSGYGLPDRHGQPLAAYASKVGQIRTVVLADGSRVTLDTASRIVPSFSGRERRVTLVGGRGRFAVAHDEERPFIVIAGHREVIARGTVFDVRFDGRNLEVVLLEGKVDIEPSGHVASRGTPIRLTPGRRAVIDEGGKGPRIEVAPQVASWTEGMISADGMPLADLVREANRYSEAPIVLGEPKLGGMRVTGAFKPGDAEALGAALAEALDLSVGTHPDGSVMLARKPV